MEILGIGPTEFLFIIVILLLVLGPSDLAQLGKKTGRMVRKLRSSETWIMISNLSRTLRNLPNALADEVESDEILREVMPERYRKPVGNLSAQGMKEREASFPAGQTVHPPEAEAFSAWTTPVAGEEIAADPESEAKDNE